jgi:hypothetical protein
MTMKSRKERIHEALDAFLDETLYPEKYDRRTHKLLPKYRAWNTEPGRPLPAPRYRLSRRLQLLSYLQAWVNRLMKEIIADVESLEDAKAYKAREDAKKEAS